MSRTNIKIEHLEWYYAETIGNSYVVLVVGSCNLLLFQAMKEVGAISIINYF